MRGVPRASARGHASDRSPAWRCRGEFLAFPDVLTRLRPEDVEQHLHPSCAALGACHVVCSAALLACACSGAARGGWRDPRARVAQNGSG